LNRIVLLASLSLRIQIPAHPARPAHGRGINCLHGAA
jgi:hypothetical protein